MINRSVYVYAATLALGVLPANSAFAASFDLNVRGSDPIFLAGRSDLVIPPASDPWTGLGTHLPRHPYPTPEEIQETIPSSINVVTGDVIRVLDPAVGGVNLSNGFGPPFFGPSGDGIANMFLTSLDGISGYIGPAGALLGVFLDNSIPNSSPAPATLDFTPAGFGTDFLTLSPQLRQIFHIGDGITSSGTFQSFVAPTGATRLFFGIPDGFGFAGVPGGYDDNDGSYQVRIGVNEIPTSQPIPEPASTLGLLALGAFGAGSLLKRK
jgi:PEP-CTERM motif